MPRKTKLFAFFLILMLAVFPLWADSYRIGVLGEDVEYCGIIKDALGIIAQVSSEDAISLFKTRKEAINHLEFLKNRGSAITSEKLSDLKKEETPYKLSLPLSLEVVEVKVDEGFASFLASGSAEAFDYLKLRENLDDLLYVKAEEGAIRDLTILMNGEGLRTVPYVKNLHDYELKALLDIFSSLYLDGLHHVYALSVDPKASALTVDGNSVVSGYVMLVEGEHSFTMDAYGYLGKTEKRELTGGELSLHFALDPSVPHSLYISSRPWNAALTFNGKAQEGKTLRGIYAPFDLGLSAEGFTNANYQTRMDVDAVSLSLKPLWGKASDVVMEKKGEFYRALFYTIGSFGGYCAANSLSNIYQDNASLRPLSVVFGGVSLVSLVYLVQSATDYFSAVGLGL